MLLNLTHCAFKHLLRKLSDQHDASAKSGALVRDFFFFLKIQQEDVLLLSLEFSSRTLVGGVRVMMPRRSGDRSAFELDLCAHQEETPAISNGEVSRRAGAPALRSTARLHLWICLHWHMKQMCKYHDLWQPLLDIISLSF